MNKQHGCKATMKRIELEQHVNEYCEYHVCGNDGCEDGKKGKAKEMKQHRQLDSTWIQEEAIAACQEELSCVQTT